ncbi:UMP-CMP kinase 2, mitochondrial [Angomonas deanei]|uniref:Deoxynucleoside kinase/Thymidylate kinase, putative n=1 Tax=Angomonas deanei TaxID=59799 RepID=S9VS83_9TRYP|nr:UMP-CMP kinase 2, mitochondrial [Angomonas deanei]EPY43684.1 UMP-CMP kinase 2, mitochondrial [Angomonas deanei]CAD2221160.1 Deoxynucleoside kinase/Thymidylate kinase, putative [Angomonas deanei]|eukprot:EPY35377.1 UMP-CMP kinase 2, mitochondrial [Angomonas deanei]
MQAVVQYAAPFHRGTNVYRSREACVAVLRMAESARLPWWNDRCSQFVREAEGCPLFHGKSGGTFPILSIEGLDGVGKSLVTRTLGEKLGGSVFSTPPSEWNDIRPLYMDEPESVARCFYSASNYMAAVPIEAASHTHPVIVDRWWSSTCAMALANQKTVSELPPSGDEIYRWPEDLLRFDHGYYLHVDEAVRTARIRARAPEQEEEKRLSAKEEMRRTAEEVYNRIHLFTKVETNTYRHAVNFILNDLTKKGLSHRAVLFSDKELNEVKPF